VITTTPPIDALISQHMYYNVSLCIVQKRPQWCFGVITKISQGTDLKKKTVVKRIDLDAHSRKIRLLDTVPSE
jgi:hypothetical protein